MSVPRENKLNEAASYTRAQHRVGKVSLATKIYQGVGALPDVFKGFAFNSLLLFYYSQVLGLSPVKASMAIGTALIVDAMVDPLIGSLSDNLKSAFGRRHLLMYLSALPLGLALYLTFSPPADAAPDSLFYWLFVCAVATNMAMSLYIVPWTALYAEFSDDYAERTTLVTYRYALGWLGGLTFTFATWTFIFPSTPSFHPGQLNPQSYRLFAPVLALAVTATVLITTHLTRREIPFLLQPTRQLSRFDVWRVLGEVGSIVSNREFVILFLGALITAGITGTTTALGIYLQTYFWALTPENLRWFAIAIFGAFAAFLLVSWIERRLDKKTVLLTCFGLLILDGLVVIGLRLLHVLPDNGDPRLIAILIANETTRVFLGTILGIMFVSMLADALDMQELRTKRRQEGVFAAALSFSGKATAGIGTVLAGLVLQYVVVWPVKSTPLAIEPQIIMRLGVVVGMLIPLLFLIPLALGTQYRITRETHEQMRKQLDKRREEALP